MNYYICLLKYLYDYMKKTSFLLNSCLYTHQKDHKLDKFLFDGLYSYSFFLSLRNTSSNSSHIGTQRLVPPESVFLRHVIHIWLLSEIFFIPFVVKIGFVWISPLSRSLLQEISPSHTNIHHTTLAGAGGRAGGRRGQRERETDLFWASPSTHEVAIHYFLIKFLQHFF